MSSYSCTTASKWGMCVCACVFNKCVWDCVHVMCECPSEVQKLLCVSVRERQWCMPAHFFRTLTLISSMWNRTNYPWVCYGQFSHTKKYRAADVGCCKLREFFIWMNNIAKKIFQRCFDTRSFILPILPLVPLALKRVCLRMNEIGGDAVCVKVCVCMFISVCACVCVRMQGDHSPGEHVEWGWRGNQTRFLDAMLYRPDGALYSSLAVQLLTVHSI